MDYFNSHAHVERDSMPLACLCCLDYFNSHAHVERDQPFTKTHVKDLNFNSHAHVERDITNITRLLISVISTHTLTWSVTLVAIACKPCASFQLTRSRGAWPQGFKGLRADFPFQLTRSRGAWRTGVDFNGVYGNFNSNAHVERDVLTQCHVMAHTGFQLTRSRGAWLHLLR